MPVKTKPSSAGMSSPKRASASPTASKRATPRTGQTETPKGRTSTTRTAQSPVPRLSTPKASTTKRKSAASPSKRSPTDLSPASSRNASRRPSAGASPSRRQSTTRQSPSRRQSAGLASASRRHSIDPLQPERCTVDGEPLSHLRKRLSKSVAADEDEMLSLPADQLLAALEAPGSEEPVAKEISSGYYPTEDPVPRAVEPRAQDPLVATQPSIKPAEPERVDELTSMLEEITNEAHVRVSVNDLVAFEYVDPESHFWRWGLGTVAGLPGPRLAQLMLWSASDMTDIPSMDCPLSPEEREAAMRELEEVRRQRDDNEIIVEDLTKKLHALTATYRAERHEYHQQMEMAEMTLRDARHEVRSLDEKDWRECRSYVNPPDIVEFIFGAVMCVLGERTSSWNETLRIMRSRDFITNITDFDPSSISAANKRVLQRKYLKDKRFTYQMAMNGSRALGALQRWVAAQTATFKASKKLQKFDLSHRDKQDEMAEVQRRLDLFKKALAKLDDQEDDLTEKLGDRPERVTFKVTPRPTDVEAARAAAAAADGEANDSGESLRGTRRTWTFTDESIVILRSSILVNYDTPDSTVVVLSDEQVEQLKGGLQARAAPYAQEQQAEKKQRKLEDEVAKLRGDMAAAKKQLDDLKAEQNEHERELAAKEREIDTLKEKLGEPVPDDDYADKGDAADRGPASTQRDTKAADEDDEDDLDQEAEYPTEDPNDGGEPADKNQSRALGPDAASAAANGASPVDGDAQADENAPAEAGTDKYAPAAGQRGADSGVDGGAPAGGPDRAPDQGSSDADAARPTPEDVQALEDALADKDREIEDLKEKLKDAEEAAKAAQDALDAAAEADAEHKPDGESNADRALPGGEKGTTPGSAGKDPTAQPAGPGQHGEGGAPREGADRAAEPREPGQTPEPGRDGADQPRGERAAAPGQGGPASEPDSAAGPAQKTPQGDGERGDDDNDDQGPEYPTEDGAPAVKDRDGAPMNPDAAARQKDYDLEKLLKALEKESKALRKAKAKADSAKTYTGKKMAKNAAFVDVMEVEDEPDEDDAPEAENDEEQQQEDAVENNDNIAQPVA